MQETPTLLRGDRQASAPLRSSAARPRPGAEPDSNPLQGERWGLDEARARARRQHVELHSATALAEESFSHPACAAIGPAERRACPLSSIRWSALRLVDGGVEIEARQPGLDPLRLRWLFLCHLALARAQADSAGCPLGTPGLAVQVAQRSGLTVVRLLVQEPSRVRELQRWLQQLVGPR